MAIVSLILGQSGTGKTASLRDCDPNNTLLIQSIKKPLSFRSKTGKKWDYLTADNHNGNIVVSDSTTVIATVARKTKRKVIVLDDFQYILANEYMRRVSETGYQKFVDIGHGAWKLFGELGALPDDVRVYILAHTDTNDMGHTKLKTIGRMLDEKTTLEGMVTICLRTHVSGGVCTFSTVNNGSDTVKAPIGMFDADEVGSNLAQVDAAICDYFSITA